MSYEAVTPQPIRLVQSGWVGQPFLSLWRCDPCRLPGRRYEVLHPVGWKEHAWHEVILPEDNARVRYLKWLRSREIAALQSEIRRLELELLRLRGDR